MMNLDELEAEALKLDLLARTELIRRLTASVTPAPAASTPTADERERLWLQEAMRRSRELRDAPPTPNPTAPPRVQADLAFASRPTRKKPSGRTTRPIRRKPAKRAKPPARPKRTKPARRSLAKPKPKPRKRPRTRR